MPHIRRNIYRSLQGAKQLVVMIDALRNAYYHLPAGFQRAALVQRRTPIWRRTGIIFIHIPKSAGTSISAALYGRFLGHVRASDIHRWGSPALQALPSFAITRNPWDRLVSAYRFVRRGGGVGEHHGGVWRPELYRGPAFESFERFVTEWLVERKIGPLEYQFHAQADYVCDSAGQLLVDHVGRIEDLDPTLEYLRERLGTRLSVPRSNTSGEAVDYRTFYTPQLVDIVGRIYERDVLTFGYAFDG